jgi:hypothetical protein
VQLEYNLTDRSIELDILPFCRKNGITILAFGPLDRGRSYVANPMLEKLSGKYGKTPSQLLLNWVVAQESVVALTMTTNPAHLSEAADAAAFDLESADRTALAAATECEVLQVMPRDVRVATDTGRVYSTLDAAVANSHDLIPHPLELAENIRKYRIEKPIRITRLSVSGAAEPYQLVGEHLRYWAWIIAYGWEQPIPAYDVTPPARMSN